MDRLWQYAETWSTIQPLVRGLEKPKFPCQIKGFLVRDLLQASQRAYAKQGIQQCVRQLCVYKIQILGK